MIKQIVLFFHRPLWFWSYFILILLLMVLPLNSAQQLNDIMVLSFRGDYLLHAIVFMPWMYFCLIYRHGVFLWMSIGLMFAACSEGLQYLLPYRAFNINDLVANMMGVLLGSLLYLIFALFNKPRVP